MQNTGYRIENAENRTLHWTQNAKYKIQNTEYQMQNIEYLRHILLKSQVYQWHISGMLFYLEHDGSIFKMKILLSASINHKFSLSIDGEHLAKVPI